MALGMRIAYRLLYACQHGRLIKDFFTAKNPASSDYLLWKFGLPTSLVDLTP